MATQIIKFNSNGTTYVPVTTSEAIQHSWGDSHKQQLKSYLGDLKASLDSSIATVAAAELATRNNLAATYIEAGSRADQISYNLPNGTYGLITVNDVAHAKGADTAEKLGSKEIKYDSSIGKISYKIGSDYTGEFEAKASKSAYGFAKVETDPTSGSTNAISSGFVKTLETKVDGKAATGHTHSLNWSTTEQTTDAGTEIAALVKVPSTTTLGTTAGQAQFTTYKLPTKKYVDEAVSGAFADVAAALKYKGTIGTGGTITALPASHDVGDVWVVSSAGNYAGKACEVGDYIVCNTKGTAANDAHWDVLNGENQVSQTNSEFKVGDAAKELAVIDGTSIKLSVKQEANVAHMSDFSSYVKTISSDPSTNPNGVITSAVKTGQNIKFTYTNVSSSGNATAATTLSSTAKTITPGWEQNSYGKITYVTGVSIKQDHEGTGTAGKLTYWNSTTAHTAVTTSYGNSTDKYVYVDKGILKEGTLPTGNKEGKNIVGASSTATANTNANAGSVYLNHIEDSVVKSAHKITGSGGISVTATDTGATITVAHSTGNGYKHIPSNGSADQVLKYSSAGTAVWSSLSAGLKYDVYNSTDDFTLDLGTSTATVSIAKTTF